MIDWKTNESTYPFQLTVNVTKVRQREQSELWLPKYAQHDKVKLTKNKQTVTTTWYNEILKGAALDLY